jgi:hypothetical protein
VKVIELFCIFLVFELTWYDLYLNLIFQINGINSN